MPSGSKKRKAAKKKKEQEANSANSATHTHGGEGMKVHDDKESDRGEVGSSASQDQNKHSFAEGKEEEMEKREDGPNVQSIASRNEPEPGGNRNADSMEQEVMEENRIIQVDWESKHEDVEVDWELKPGNDAHTKEINVEYVECVKELVGGQITQTEEGSSSSSSSSSSSDDESRVIEENTVVNLVRESEESKKDILYSIAESVNVTDPITTSDHAIVENTVVIESGESKEEVPSFVAESVAVTNPVTTTDLPEVTKVTEGVPAKDAFYLAAGNAKEEAGDPIAGDDPPVNVVEPVELPEATTITDGVSIIKVYSSNVANLKEGASDYIPETIPPVDSESVSKEVVRVNESVPVEPVLPSNAFELGLKANGKTECSGLSPVLVDIISEPKENNVSLTNVENPEVSMVAAQEDEDKLLPSSSLPEVDSSNGTKNRKDIAVTESDGQPLVGSTSQTKRTTSWMSCCGLFEVFTGSHR